MWIDLSKTFEKFDAPMIASLKVDEDCIGMNSAKELKGSFTIRDLTHNIDAL